MTVKELSAFTGKQQRTVQRWVKNASDKMSSINEKMSSSNSTYPADYNVDEVEQILLSSSMSKDAVYILMENARRTPTNQVAPSVDYEKIGLMIGVAVSKAIADAVPTIIKAVKPSIPIQIEEKQDRDSLRQLIGNYAKDRCLGDYRNAWHVLYEELYYRNKINVSVRAKNEGIKSIDYLDREGLIPQCCAIMRQLEVR